MTKLGYGDPQTWGNLHPYQEVEIEKSEKKKRFYPREVKKQIELWIRTGYNGDKIVAAMKKYYWFRGMTD